MRKTKQRTKANRWLTLNIKPIAKSSSKYTNTDVQKYDQTDEQLQLGFPKTSKLTICYSAFFTWSCVTQTIFNLDIQGFLVTENSLIGYWQRFPTEMSTTVKCFTR